MAKRSKWTVCILGMGLFTIVFHMKTAGAVKGTRYKRVTTDVPKGLDFNSFSKVDRRNTALIKKVKEQYKNNTEVSEYMQGLTYNTLGGGHGTEGQPRFVVGQNENEVLIAGIRNTKDDFYVHIKLDGDSMYMSSVHQDPKTKEYKKYAATIVEQGDIVTITPKPIKISKKSLLSEEAKRLNDENVFPMPSSKDFDEVMLYVGNNVAPGAFHNPWVWQEAPNEKTR